jgi:hypothetical protein
MREKLPLAASIGVAMFVMACQLTGRDNSTPMPPTVQATLSYVPSYTPILPTPTIVVPLPFFDDFSTNAYGWQTGLVHGDYGDTNYEIISGAYRWTIISHKNASSIALPDLPALLQSTVTVDALLVEGGLDDSSCGIIYQSIDKQKYFLFVISNLQYGVQFHDNAAGFLEMVPWSLTYATIPGGVNQLKLVVTNNIYDFYINDIMVTRFVDSRIPDGSPGLYVGVFGTDATYEFDNFSVTSP